jgi:hypothetical protein
LRGFAATPGGRVQPWRWRVATGNQKGDQVAVDAEALDFAGYSGFAEVKFPWIDSSLIDWDTDGGPAPPNASFGAPLTTFSDTSWTGIGSSTRTQSESVEKTVKATLQVSLP